MENKNISYKYAVIFFAILLCYFNVIIHPQIYYDDYSNVFVPALLGNGFNIHSLIEAMKFHVGGFRPISYLSFYLNHYLFGGNIRSFVIVNILIHFLNSIIFYKIALKLTNNEKVAFFTSLFWAVNPVNLFAVSYIVQRMTSLMTLFGGIATLYYLKWEKERNTSYLIYSIIFVIIAILTKENGFLFLALFLTHYYIFHGTKKDLIKIYLTGFLFLVFLYIFSKNYFQVQFINRHMTPWGRLLTELRILVHYIQNILFPLEKNIYLVINFKPSTGLFTPISTLLSLIILSILLGIPYITFRKDKIISLSLLGFFLFHIIESTFLPLHIAFFHRNYIASFFLILAVFKALDYFKKEKIKYAILIVLILNGCWVTILHNLKWYYKPYYIQQNYKNYPQSIVAKTQYALELQKQGEIDKALNTYLELMKTHKRTIPFISIVELFHIKGLNKEALALANLYPDKDPELRRIMALCYISLNQLEKANKYFESYLKENFSPSVFFDYLLVLYERNYFDEVIFQTDKYQNQLLFKLTSNKSLSQIYNIDYNLMKIMLLKIECKIRIGLESDIEKDIDLLKSHNLYNKQVKNYIEALIYIKNKEYQKALDKLNSLTFQKITDTNLFLIIKKLTFILCIYDKTGQQAKFQKLIEKLSKNTIIYNSIWIGLDKCY